MRTLSHQDDIINIFSKWLGIVLYLVIALEMVFFPSWENLSGCAMTLICWLIFKNFFLKRRIILEYPFAFMMFLSMFLYRYLPLISTLIEGKPITYGFEMAFDTFFYETVLFIVAALAFGLACKSNMRNGIKKNNAIQKLLYRVGFFERCEPIVIWGMGLVGLVVRISIFGSGSAEYGDVGGKFLSGLTYLSYAPICLLFPDLLRIGKTNERLVYIYLALIFIMNIATNSRQALIMPLAIYFLLLILQMLRNSRINITRSITPGKLVIGTIALVFVLNLLSDLSLAMLATRSFREDISRRELFNETVKTYQDEDLMQQLRVSADKDSGGDSGASDGKLESYSTRWNETYIDNFMLNRYANMRISDETIYLAQRVGFGNEKMQEKLYGKVIRLLPTPLLNFFGLEIDKSGFLYSSADFLHALAFNTSIHAGFRVTSHIGDGLATFSYWYFIIQFLWWFLVFKLLNCLVFFSKQQGVVYSVYGLMNVFVFLGMFRNSGGVFVDIAFVLRGFWQGCFTYLVVFYIVKKSILVMRGLNLIK